mmetsp:Transcript_112327/g.239881  ORF Transcript_112327/g.239881 Transcript_112327/m.239881 type:complete len:236 (-) Transcript_112327:47-754(-)
MQALRNLCILLRQLPSNALQLLLPPLLLPLLLPCCLQHGNTLGLRLCFSQQDRGLRLSQPDLTCKLLFLPPLPLLLLLPLLRHSDTLGLCELELALQILALAPLVQQRLGELQPPSGRLKSIEVLPLAHLFELLAQGLRPLLRLLGLPPGLLEVSAQEAVDELCLYALGLEACLAAPLPELRRAHAGENEVPDVWSLILRVAVLLARAILVLRSGLHKVCPAGIGGLSEHALIEP